jgi:hypothetical protein
MSNWIKGAIKHPGALRKVAAEHGGIDKSTGNIKQSFLNKAESGAYGATNARRAQLAETLEGFHKKK